MASILSLAELFTYKKEVAIKDPRTDRVLTKVWVRVLGDLDLTKAYKQARIASSSKRAALRNPETEDYQDEVLGIVDLNVEDKKEIIRTSKMQNIITEATVAVERPELPELEEVAVDPDASSLEELEDFDKLNEDTANKYQIDIEDYIKERTTELNSMLDSLSEEELTKLAQEEISNIIPFSIFLAELNTLKIFYGTYTDKECKTSAFSELEDVKQLPKPVQEQLINAINELEISGEQIKN